MPGVGSVTNSRGARRTCSACSYRSAGAAQAYSCILLSLLLPLDVFYNVFTHGDGDNARRFITGLLWGFCATGATLQLLRLLSLRLAQAKTRLTSATG